MRSVAKMFLCLCSFLLAPLVVTADLPDDPHALISALRERLYSIGERSANGPEMLQAEREVAAQMRRITMSSYGAALTSKNAKGRTPLTAAAFAGYPRLIEALLESDQVRRSIDTVDDNGLSAWDHANLAYYRSVWACRPSIFAEPFSWIPKLVLQPYYANSVSEPYKNTRQLLEQAGARTDIERSRKFWIDNCGGQSAQTRDKVLRSTDLQQTLISEGATELERALSLLESAEE